MARLTEIIAEIADMLAEITVAAGYECDIGTINEPDEALVCYPSVVVTYKTEQRDTSIANGIYGHAIASIEIKAVSHLETVEDVPTLAIDAEYDKIIASIKKRLGVNASELALDGNPVITYQGFEKYNSTAGSVFVPGHVVMRYECRYQFTEQG